MPSIIFIHGLESTGEGFKSKLLRSILPECLTPTFKAFSKDMAYHDLLETRMAQLKSILERENIWIIIGSSFGGMMGAIYTCQFPQKVARLILLAPALAVPDLNPKRFSPINTPVIVFHGKDDKVVSLKSNRSRAESLFSNLTYNVVDDDHKLHSTVKKSSWKKLLFDT